MMFKMVSPVTLAVIAAVGLLVSASPTPVNAAELVCDTLAGRLKSGDDYRLKLELQSQKIRIEFGDAFCSEPAKSWFARRFVLPLPADRNSSLPLAALEAPDSEISVRIRKKMADGKEAVPLPGQTMRQGPLPDLGFGSSGKEVVPLPIERADKKAEADEPGKNENIAADQPVAEPVTDPATVMETLTAPEADNTPDAEQPSPTISGVRISTDPDGGSTKVTKYKAEPQKPGRSTATDDAGAPTDQTSAPTDDATAPPPGAVAPSSLMAEPQTASTCDRELTDFWKAGKHMVGGKETNLRGVFTVDINNDGRVDNVGFKIGALGRIGNVLNYFPVTKGRLAARTVPTLKLNNDDDIHRLCPGNVTFSAMSREERQKAINSAKRRQQELVANARKVKDTGQPKKDQGKDEGEGEQDEEEEPDQSAIEKTENLLFWAIIVAIVFFVMGGFGLFFAIRNMRSNDDEDDEEDEVDEEDEEDDGDEDDYDEEEEEK